MTIILAMIVRASNEYIMICVNNTTQLNKLPLQTAIDPIDFSISW